MSFGNFVVKRRGVKFLLDEELENSKKIEDARTSKH
jgi:hypothetical protein